MKNIDLVFAYEYSKTRWDHFKKMGRTNNFLILFAFLLIALFLFPFYWLIYIFLSFYVKKYNFDDTVSFCFTLNHITVVNNLKKKTFQNVNIGVGKTDFSNKILLLAFFSNYNLLPNFFKILSNRHMSFNTIKAFKTIGVSNLFEIIFKKHYIKNIIQFNDHGPLHFDLHRQSKLNKTKTLYIQHAPITKEFPALYHDVNILFSQDSFDKYKKVTNDIEVVLNKDIRFPKKNSNITKNVKKVVLCPNILDDLSEIIKTYSNLKNEGYQVLLRKHPGDRRHFPIDINISTNASIWQDLSDAKFVVTNESAVTLEGLYYNCLCYKTSCWSESIDGYGFMNKGLIISEFNTQKALLDAIKNKEVTTDISRLSYFIGDQSKELSLNSFFD